ncbi:MAG TPA: peptidoglycan-binding domain-containing protein, partial [Ilumatobacteraceae bacterium]
FVLQKWSGLDLGILARPPRPIRGGSSASMHNWGMAWDWRWADPGPGRGAADEVIEYAISNSTRLGIQAVHDYVNARYWKNNAGWRTARSSPETGFGQPWSQWLHIERTWEAANRPDPLDQSAAATDAPGTDTTSGRFEGALPTGPLRRGDKGADVARIQDFLRSAGFADFSVSDGEFGPRTDAAVRAAQTAFAAEGRYTLAIDGIWGPATADAASRFGAE